MGNIVTVTRAPRLKLVKSQDIPVIALSLSASGSIRAHHYHSVICLSDSDDELWEDPRLYYVFDGYKSMCEWVSNGRKMEDLQGDSKREWTSPSMVEIGTIFTCKYVDTDACYIKINDTEFYDLEAGEIDDPHLANIWPLNPTLGDSITITPQP